MALIEVEEKDVEKVFEILVQNGRFIGLPHNQFRIVEHPDEVLDKIKEAGLQVKVLSHAR